MKSISTLFSKISNRLKLSKLNFLNHKFKKYIIKYEIVENKIKIYNSNGDYKFVKNNIENKVKVMEIIKDHYNAINEEIEYYNNNKNDYKILLFVSSIVLIVLGLFSLFTFFIGNYYLLVLAILAFLITLTLYILNIYNLYIFREEVKRLESIKNNNLILVDNEIITLFKDLVIYVKDFIYRNVLKIVNITLNKGKI